MWSPIGRTLTGADEAAIVDGLIGRQEILGGSIATHRGGMAVPPTLWLKQLVYMLVAAAVVLVASVGETAAEVKSGETAAQPKKILLLHTFGPNFEQGSAWSREIQ